MKIIKKVSKILAYLMPVAFILLTSLPASADTTVTVNNNGNDQAGFGLTSNYTQNGQGFKVTGQNYYIKTVNARMRTVGSPSDQVFITINTNNPSGEIPTNTVLATSNNVTIVTETDYTFTFSTPVELTDNVQYWFVFKRTGSADDTNYFRNITTSSNTYANGRWARNAGSYDWSEGLTSYDVRMSFVWDTYVAPVLGCMDEEATNYDPEATEDDDSCTYGHTVTPRASALAHTAQAPIQKIGTVAKNGFPWVLGLLAALIGLGILIRYVYHLGQINEAKKVSKMFGDK